MKNILTLIIVFLLPSCATVGGAGGPSKAYQCGADSGDIITYAKTILKFKDEKVARDFVEWRFNQDPTYSTLEHQMYLHNIAGGLLKGYYERYDEFPNNERIEKLAMDWSYANCM